MHGIWLIIIPDEHNITPPKCETKTTSCTHPKSLPDKNLQKNPSDLQTNPKKKPTYPKIPPEKTHLVDGLAAGGLRLQMSQGCGSCDTASQWAIGDAERYTWRSKHVKGRNSGRSNEGSSGVNIFPVICKRLLNAIKFNDLSSKTTILVGI